MIMAHITMLAEPHHFNLFLTLGATLDLFAVFFFIRLTVIAEVEVAAFATPVCGLTLLLGGECSIKVKTLQFLVIVIVVVVVRVAMIAASAFLCNRLDVNIR